MSSPPVTVQLGEHSYHLVAQRHARIWRTLPDVVSHAADIELDGSDLSSLVASLGDGVHAVLQVFIPDLMPAWKFDGFASEQAREQNAYDPDADRSPTQPELLDAFEAAWRVNGMHRVGQSLGKLLGPDLTAPLRTLIVGRIRTMTDSPTSPSSPPENGESASTSSTTSPPTSPGAGSD